MVATLATMETMRDSPVLEMADRMEKLASRGDWHRAEELATSIRRALLDVSVHERRELVAAVGRCLARVQTLALTSRIEVAEKLSGIRRGREVSEAYAQSST